MITEKRPKHPWWSGRRRERQGLGGAGNPLHPRPSLRGEQTLRPVRRSAAASLPQGHWWEFTAVRKRSESEETRNSTYRGTGLPESSTTAELGRSTRGPEPRDLGQGARRRLGQGQNRVPPTLLTPYCRLMSLKWELTAKYAGRAEGEEQNAVSARADAQRKRKTENRMEQAFLLQPNPHPKQETPLQESEAFRALMVVLTATELSNPVQLLTGNSKALTLTWKDLPGINAIYTGLYCLM